ncbi:MAG: electron transfer flavoprotein subunit beta/FixA family protein [Deltaproteobacteria bacterium]|nr:electron transfer flavoprotein subunit beta/FixA family protein [Deltaproteobacteria bacterium]MBW1984708.1 electron transfer flavoprotein subunit beta/FixA family protein [Deltaproteobacteria bacterium]
MGLKIIVCIKSVIINAPAGKSRRSVENCVLNPFDRPALELALNLREENGGNVTILSMGPDASESALLEAMAMGADKAVLLNDPALAGSDTLATSKALCAALATLGTFDLLLFGTRTADSDTGQVGPQTAVGLNLPLVTGARSVNVQKDRLFVTRRLDGMVEEFEATLPAALTIHPKAVKARDIELGGIESAYQKTKIKRISLKDIGLSPNDVGDAGSPTKVISMKRATQQRECEILSGTVENQAANLLEKLISSGLIK